MEMTDEDFERYVLYGVDGEDFPPEAYSVEVMRKSVDIMEIM